MQVRVRYFAALREARGTSAETLEVPAGQSVATLYAQLFSTEAGPVAFSRNQAICSPQTVITDGDEIGFLPPLGGG